MERQQSVEGAARIIEQYRGDEEEDDLELTHEEEATEVVYAEIPKSTNVSQLRTAGLLPFRSPSIRETEQKLRSEGALKSTTDNKRRRGMLHATVCVALVVLIALIVTLSLTLRKDDTERPRESASISDPIVTPTNGQCDTSSRLDADGSTEVIKFGNLDDTYWSSQGTCGTVDYGEHSGVWFEVTGTGNSLKLRACTESCSVSNIVVPEAAIFSGDCESMECVDGTTTLGDASLRWRTTEGEKYYIFLYSQNHTSGTYEISVSD